MNTLKIFFFFIFTFRSLAGAQIPAQGKSEWYFTYEYYKTSKVFNNDSESNNYSYGGEFSKNEISYFGLYSLSSTLALVAKGDIFTTMEYQDDFNTLKSNGIGDNSIGARKVIIHTGEHVQALQALLTFPLYSKDKAPALGTHQLEFELRYLLDWYQVSEIDFISVESGLVLRFGPPDNQLKFDVLAGENFDKLLVTFGVFSTFDVKSNSQRLPAPTGSHNWDQIKIGPSIAYPITKTSTLQLGYNHEIWGKNTGNGNSIYLSFWIKN